MTTDWGVRAFLAALRAAPDELISRFNAWATNLDKRNRGGEFGKWPWQEQNGLWPWQKRRKP